MMAARRAGDDAPPAVQKTYEFVLWLVQKVENFPRSYRFTVGDRLTTMGPNSIEPVNVTTTSGFGVSGMWNSSQSRRGPGCNGCAFPLPNGTRLTSVQFPGAGVEHAANAPAAVVGSEKSKRPAGSSLRECQIHVCAP